MGRPKIEIKMIITNYVLLSAVLFDIQSISSLSTNTKPKGNIKANSWQSRLDKAFLDPSNLTNPQARFRSFQRALQDPDLSKDVSKAINVIRDKGFGKGHPELIETLWPKGTIARDDLEGILALRSQLPERLDQIKSLEVISSTFEAVSDGLKIGNREVLTSSVVDTVRNEREKVSELVMNGLRSVPKGVEGPVYSLLGTLTSTDDIDDDDKDDDDDDSISLKEERIVQLRKYEGYKAASVNLANSNTKGGQYTLKNMGKALAQLTSYTILGNNEDNSIMSMTSPFTINDDDSSSTMSIKIPKSFADYPPEPITSSGEDSVSIVDISASTMATLSFRGICTNQEIERQSSILRQILAMNVDRVVESSSNNSIDTETSPVVVVMQYNAPGTLPWRRRNEIGVFVEMVEDNAATSLSQVTVEVDKDAEKEVEEVTKEEDVTVAILEEDQKNDKNIPTETVAKLETLEKTLETAEVETVSQEKDEEDEDKDAQTFFDEMSNDD